MKIIKPKTVLIAHASVIPSSLPKKKRLVDQLLLTLLEKIAVKMFLAIWPKSVPYRIQVKRYSEQSWL